MNFHNLSTNFIKKLQWAVRLLSVAAGFAIIASFAVTTKEFSYEYQYWIVLLILLTFPATALISCRWHAIGGLLAMTISISAICISLLFITSEGGFGILIYTLIHSRVWEIYTRILLGLSITFLALGFLHIFIGWWKHKHKGT